MPDEPIGMFELNLPPEGGGDGVNASSLLPSIASIRVSVLAISKNVTALLQVTKLINGHMARLVSMQTGVLQRATMGAGGGRGGFAGAASRTLPWSSFMPAGGFRVGGSARTGRFFTDAAASQVGAVTSDLVWGAKAASLSGGRAASTTALRRGGNAAAMARRGVAAVPYGGRGSVMAGWLAGAIGSQSLAIGATALGVPAMLAGSVAGLMSMGRSQRVAYSAFSPQIAGYQAQVDITKTLATIQAANSPLAIRAARFSAAADAMWESDPILNLLGAGKMGLGGLATMFALGNVAPLPRMVLWALKKIGIDPMGAMGLGQGAAGGGAINNSIMWDTINRMTDGLMDMQATPTRGADFKRTNGVRWKNGRNGRGHWERYRTEGRKGL